MVIQYRCVVEGLESLPRRLYGEVDLSKVLPLQEIVGCELHCFCRSILRLTVLAQLDVALAEHFPGVRITWLLSCPFHGVENDHVPIAFLLQRPHLAEKILARGIPRRRPARTGRRGYRLGRRRRAREGVETRRGVGGDVLSNRVALG